jgi:hypothetical protein
MGRLIAPPTLDLPLAAEWCQHPGACLWHVLQAGRAHVLRGVPTELRSLHWSEGRGGLPEAPWCSGESAARGTSGAHQAVLAGLPSRGSFIVGRGAPAECLWFKQPGVHMMQARACVLFAAVSGAACGPYQLNMAKAKAFHSAGHDCSRCH